MNDLFLLLTIGLSALNISFIVLIFHLAKFILQNWKDIRSVDPIWKNKYPSFEEFHSLFDRGDLMTVTVVVASILQLSHPGISGVLETHSTYRSDYWRRAIRTMTFIYIMIRATSSEREAIVVWLRKLHRSIPLFAFETNVIVLATFAYGLVKAHQFLGDPSPEQVDGIVKGVMTMVDRLDPEEKGRRAPSTMTEVEHLLRRELPMNVDELLIIHAESTRSSSTWNEMRKQHFSTNLRMPMTLTKLMLFETWVRKVSKHILRHDSGNQSILARPFWWCARKIHLFLSYFHYSMCPKILTFDGTLKLLVTANPRMKEVPMELYCEIFGKDNDRFDDSHEEALRRFSDTETPLPRMEIDKKPMPQAFGFHEEAMELVRCSYHRGKLARSMENLPNHLGIIMDGNRRYSRHRKFDGVVPGHQVGAHKLLQVLSWTFSCGIRNLTVWALSDDNLKRGPQELNSLFAIMSEYMSEMGISDSPFAASEIRFRVVGNRSVLPDHLNEMILRAEAATAQNYKFNLQIALGYGGRAEVTRATKLAVSAKVAQEGVSIEAAVEQITEADISRQTYSAQLGLPQIDTIIRTSGENRLSGFALWESYHAEFAIVRENWPELKESTFLRNVLDLSKRNRRFGA